LRHRIVGGFLADVDAGDMRAFPREQHRHCPTVADRRFFVDDVALASANHDDAAALQAAVVQAQAIRHAAKLKDRSSSAPAWLWTSEFSPRFLLSILLRHCERSEAILGRGWMDCFVAMLLAMTE
jgi:hypothetical protein